MRMLVCTAFFPAQGVDAPDVVLDIAADGFRQHLQAFPEGPHGLTLSQSRCVRQGVSGGIWQACLLLLASRCGL